MGGCSNQDHRVVERPYFDERAFEWHLELAEERGPASEGDGIDERPVLVDEIEPHEGGGKLGTAVEQMPSAGSPLAARPRCRRGGLPQRPWCSTPRARACWRRRAWASDTRVACTRPSAASSRGRRRRSARRRPFLRHPEAVEEGVHGPHLVVEVLVDLEPDNVRVDPSVCAVDAAIQGDQRREDHGAHGVLLLQRLRPLRRWCRR